MTSSPDDSLPGGLFPPQDAGRMECAPAEANGNKQELPKRFYTQATAEERDGLFVLLLDGRQARTPGRAPLGVPDAGIAAALAQEWNAQETVINPATMPLTRMVNSIIDGVSQSREAVTDEIVRYAGSDLLCYRADAPERLVQSQRKHWDPVLDWARQELGARFILSEGVMFVQQPEESVMAIRRAVTAQPSHFTVGALHVLTTMGGSVLLALALGYQNLDLDSAWAAAHVDEDVQMEIWGQDEEAMLRRAARFKEFEAASQLLAAFWREA